MTWEGLIVERVQKPVEVLLAEVGAAAIPEALGPRSSQDLVRAGQRWLATNVDRLREQLCPHMDDIRSRPTSIDAIAAIADLVAGINHIPAVAAVSVLLYRFGLNALCQERSEE